jgi:serine/threonine protein phosphatase PrpC
VLTNYLGGHHGKVKADVRWLRVRDGDVLVLCTDGLYDMVDDRAIAGILGQNHPSHESAKSLVQAALKGGGKDNVTIIVARYSVPIAALQVGQESGEYARPVNNPAGSIGATPQGFLASMH